MSPPRPALRALARSLLEDEALHGGGSMSDAVVEEVFRRLRDRLSTLIGAGGFTALLRRSLTLAKVEAPALEGVEVTPGGSLSGLPAALAGRTASEAAEAAACLLAHLLELLASFIGADLTSRLAGKIQRRDGSEER